MPAKSKQQFKQMFVLYKEGKISKKELDDFTGRNNVDFSHLPNKTEPVHLEHKKKKK